MGIAVVYTWYSWDSTAGPFKESESLDQQLKTLEDKELKAVQIGKAFKNRTNVEFQQNRVKDYLLNEARSWFWIPWSLLSTPESVRFVASMQQEKDLLLDRLGTTAVPSGTNDMWDLQRYVRDPALDDESKYTSDYFVKADYVLDLLRKPEGISIPFLSLSFGKLYDSLKFVANIPSFPSLEQNWLTWKTPSVIPLIQLRPGLFDRESFLMAFKIRFQGPTIWLRFKEGETIDDFLTSFCRSTNLDRRFVETMKDPIAETFSLFVSACQAATCELATTNPFYIAQSKLISIFSQFQAYKIPSVLIPSPVRIIIEYNPNPFNPEDTEVLARLQKFLYELHAKEVASALILSPDVTFIQKWQNVDSQLNLRLQTVQ